MVGGWLLAGNLKERFRATINHPIFIFPAILYAIQLSGLWNTQDTGWGLHDLRIKLPILLLPFLIVAGPGTDRQFKAICLRALLTGVLVVTLVGSFRVLSDQVSLLDFRSMSPFISHIRLSLLLVFSIVAILLLLKNRSQKTGHSIAYALLALWFLVYLILLQSITGLTILAVVVLAGAIYLAIHSGKKQIRIIMILLLITGGGAGVMLIRYITVDSLKPGRPRLEDLAERSPLGFDYRNQTDRVEMENGRYVWVEYSEIELDSAWRMRSGISLWEPDSSGNILLSTLMRYLTFLGYSKDMSGVGKLTDEQVRQIEAGFPTPLHARPGSGIGLRIHELAREYRIYHYTGFAQGHTFAQRLEYQRAAWDIIRHNPWTGVGTGDLEIAYKDAYTRINTTLDPTRRLRAHNQYLSIAVANGLWAMGFMIIMLLLLLIRSIRKGHLLHTVFLIIAACSFLTEDTLETQAGVTFFAFLCSLTQGWIVDDSDPENKA